MVGFVKRKVKSLTLGEKLKKIRKKAGVSLAEIASHTKIKQGYLKKIEAGNFEKLPFDVYVKGFLRGYAKYLELNPEKVVAQFNKEVGIRANVKKYREKSKNRTNFKIPNLTITPRAISVFFSAVLVSIGVIYFYLEVDHFSKEPNLTIENPGTNKTVDCSFIEIIGFTDFENKVTINNEPIYVDSEGKFKELIGLQEGPNEITIEAFNKFERNTQRIVNVVANYEPSILGEKIEEESEVSLEEDKFVMEIESRESSVWISVKIDEEEKQSSIIHPGTILKVNAKNKIEIDSGKARDTYVRINEEEFFVLDEKNKGYKKVSFDKKGVIENEEKDNKN